MDFLEDLSPFFGEFADAGLLAGQPVRGIYNDGTANQPMGGLRVLAEDISFLLPTASVPAGVTGATLVIPQGTYRVRRAEDDQPDMTLLLLELP